MLKISWKSRTKDERDSKRVLDYLAKVRGVEDLKEYLNPSSSVVNSPLLLKNLKEAVERVMYSISDDEKMIVVADP